jgi:demethylmenaquinone methyltransferase / 2-methoxy-6-polyprenyl-1,4-benzoquinol methylase
MAHCKGTCQAEIMPPLLSGRYGKKFLSANKERNHIRRMFDAIADRYDLVNRLLSFRRDIAWRRAMVAALPDGGGMRVLDLATGTCDVLLTLLDSDCPVASVVGADVSQSMLRLGGRKVAAAGKTVSVSLFQADATALCFRDGAFDAVSVAFGVRNFSDLQSGLREMRRVLRPGGRALILEFSLPANRMIRYPYLLYFRHVLPFIGGVISRQPDAYRYLNRSVEAFPYGTMFCDLLSEAGFVRVTAMPLTFGIATLYTGDRSD